MATKSKKSKRSYGKSMRHHKDYDEVKDLDDNDAGLVASAYKELQDYQESRNKRKSKNGRTVNTKKKKEKLSIEYSQALDEVSDVNFDNCITNLDLLVALRTVLLNTLKTSRGAFNAKPTQGNAVVTARLVSDIQDISKLIEDAIDFEDLSAGVIQEVIKPFIERLILELGQIIQETVDTFGTTQKKRKALKRYFNAMYRNYGSHVETKVSELDEKLTKYILQKV